MTRKYVIGVDYGTDSARALIVDALNGSEVGVSVKYYPRWMEGKYSNPLINQFRHHPLDYIEVLEDAIKEALTKSPIGTAENVVGIGFDTTGSTPCLVTQDGMPLSLLPKFTENPNGMFILWKDHTSIKEAEEINVKAHSNDIDYTKYIGGIYSAEWFWAKALHVLRNDPSIRNDAYSIVELCEWLPALITGVKKSSDIVRSRCSAGHKTMWHESWNGLPPESFFVKLDPLLAGYRSRLFERTETADKPVGYLCEEWSKRLGIPTSCVVAGGAFDCHMGAVGAGIVEKTIVRTMGTSTCDIIIARPEEIGDRTIKGICGQVNGSVIPGMLGLEAGQSCYGDVYAWFKDVLMYPIKEILANSTSIDDTTKRNLIDEVTSKILPSLSSAAEKIPISESTILATDWLNGRRTPDANQSLKGSIVGLTLGSTAPRIYRALVEATAYGSRAIIERCRDEGVSIESCIAIGGIALKNPFIMQVLSDVINMHVKVCNSEQACALGAAMFAAVAAGVYPEIGAAIQSMNSGFRVEYVPNAANAAVYDKIYNDYIKLGKFSETEFFF
jgi:L-ribulokinase